MIEEEEEGAEEDENDLDDGEYNPDIFTYTSDQRQEVERLFNDPIDTGNKQSVSHASLI